MIKHLLQTPRVRFDAISDGIFAIAMTIMVLEIKLPETHDTVSQPQLLESMSALLPTLLAFFISFTLLANLWASHSRLPSAELLSRKTVEYNFHFLLFVCLMPFPTALLNRIGFVPLAAILFSINLAAAMLALARLRSHILKETNAPAAVRQLQRQRFIICAACCIAGLLLCALSYATNNQAVAVLGYGVVIAGSLAFRYKQPA